MKESTVFPILPLGKICILHSGGTPRRSNNKYYGGNIPWAKIADLDTENGIVVDTEEYITVEGLKAINNRIFPKGSILLAMYGSIGKLAIAGRDISCNQAILGIQIKDKEHLDINYLRLWLTSIKATLEFQGRGVTQQNISKSIVEKLKIPLPPLEEQRRIAAILDKADGVRRKRKEAIRLTEELLRSTFLEMFGDPENSVYPVKTLNDVCSKITDGAHFTPTYTSTGVPFLRVTDIQNDFIDWENVKHIPIEEHKELIKRCHPKRGDILYSKNGTIGIPKIIDWDNDFSIFVSLALLSPKKEIILSDFLESFLRTPFALRQALSHTKTGTVSNLHLVEIRKVKLPVPDIHIQEQWILYKSEIHKMRNQLSGAFDESENLFNSLLQRAFRGEL